MERNPISTVVRRAHDAAAGRLFDMAGGIILVWLGAVGVGLFVAIVAVEAIVLHALGWGRTFGDCALHSFLANLASTILGVVFAQVFPTLGGGWWIGLWVLCGVASFALEAGVLAALRVRPSASAWRASLIANAVSYAGLFVLVQWWIH